jgi:hypothetical protein
MACLSGSVASSRAFLMSAERGTAAFMLLSSCSTEDAPGMTHTTVGLARHHDIARTGTCVRLVHGGDGGGEFEMTSQFVVMDGGAGSGDEHKHKGRNSTTKSKSCSSQVCTARRRASAARRKADRIGAVSQSLERGGGGCAKSQKSQRTDSLASTAIALIFRSVSRSRASWPGPRCRLLSRFPSKCSVRNRIWEPLVQQVDKSKRQYDQLF